MIRKLFTATLCLFAASLHAQSAPITGATCVSTGTVQVPVTIRITSGTFDGGCKTYIPGLGANTNVVISNCIFKNARNVYRQALSTTFPFVARIDRCDISGMTDQIFRADSVNATASLTNSRLSNNRTMCTGYAPGNCIASGNVTY